MDDKKRILLFGFIVVVLFFGLYSLKQLFVQKPVGGDRDEHGCLVSAGYSWCEPKRKCLRTWEEACYPEIKDFEDCVKAGFPVLESFPRQCRTPDGNAFTEVANESGGEEPIGGVRDEYGCLTPAGYSWCEAKKKCLRVWEEDCPLSEEACTAAGGNWNTCSSKCRLDNQGRGGVVCTMLCEALCECGGIAGFGCPVGYSCRIPKVYPDALGYCVPAAAGDASGRIAPRQ